MLYQILKSASEQFPDNIAANHQNKEYSYRELRQLTDRLAISLENLALQQGDNGSEYSGLLIFIHYRYFEECQVNFDLYKYQTVQFKLSETIACLAKGEDLLLVFSDAFVKTGNLSEQPFRLIRLYHRQLNNIKIKQSNN